MKKLLQTIKENDEKFDEKFGFYEIYICADCGHTKEDHYWNGGGRPEASGYDRCRIENCKCISENWKTEKQKEDNTAIKSHLKESKIKELEALVEYFENERNNIPKTPYSEEQRTEQDEYNLGRKKTFTDITQTLKDTIKELKTN